MRTHHNFIVILAALYVTSIGSFYIVLFGSTAWLGWTAYSLSADCKANSHIPCRAPAVLRQYRVLRESPRGRRKYPNCQSYILTNWYASDNNLRGTPRGNRKKPKACRSPTCRLWTADANSRMPCHAHAATMPRCVVVLRIRFQYGIVVAWHGHSMACVNHIRPYCVNQMGKPLVVGYGMGTAWERHGMCGLAFK
jgi:hypothetical protein